MAILDTNFLIALETHDRGALRWLQAHRSEEHHVPDFVAVEYLTGHADPDEAWDAVQGAFTVAYGTPDWVKAASRLRRDLRRRHARFRSPDFWLAAWAHFLEAPVVTRDRSLVRTFGVRVEDW